MGDVPLVMIDVHDSSENRIGLGPRDGLEPDRFMGRLARALPVGEPVTGDPGTALRDPLEDSVQELPDFRGCIVQARRPDGLEGHMRLGRRGRPAWARASGSIRRPYLPEGPGTGPEMSPFSAMLRPRSSPLVA